MYVPVLCKQAQYVLAQRIHTHAQYVPAICTHALRVPKLFGMRSICLQYEHMGRTSIKTGTRNVNKTGTGTGTGTFHFSSILLMRGIDVLKGTVAVDWGVVVEVHHNTTKLK